MSVICEFFSTIHVFDLFPSENQHTDCIALHCPRITHLDRTRKSQRKDLKL